MLRCFPPSLPRSLAALALAAALSCVVGCGDESTPAPAALPDLLPLHAVRSDSPAMVDSAGRQVLLRGVNLNSLGDYFQGNPALPPVIPLRDDEFARIASHGFNVVRLILSWSSLEPEPGVISAEYIGRIRDAVARAKENRVYVVLDMHQDAWGKYIATPPGVECGGREAAIGWDGAPEWATITDGKSTCRQPGSRELSPAVMTSFENFYADRDGIQSHLIAAWAALVREFAGEPAVAGYDLLNEPNFGANILAGAPKLAAFTSRVIPALREAEQQAGGFHHIIFFEPVITFPVDQTAAFSPDFTDDTNIVFAPHNYAESITGLNQLSIEETFSRSASAASKYETTFWVGEFGWFGDPAAQLPLLRRYAAQEDQYRVSGTWWQWRQACGDPHSVGHVGGDPGPLVQQFNGNGCPGDIDLGPVPQWKVILSRPYPRAVPGRLLSLASDGEARMLHLTGEANGPGTAELWVPEGAGQPLVSGTSVGAVEVTPVTGGYIVRVNVSGEYEIDVR